MPSVTSTIPSDSIVKSTFSNWSENEQAYCQIDFGKKKGNIATAETEHEIKADGSFDRQKIDSRLHLEMDPMNFQLKLEVPPFMGSDLSVGTSSSDRKETSWFRRCY